MTRKAGALLGILMLVVVPRAWSLGLGDIQLRSALGQPLDARIPLLVNNPRELDQLHFALASPRAFSAAGVQRSLDLTKLRFNLVKARGGDYIAVSTHEPVREPYLDFLLAVDWPSGNLVREFTVLLNPPGYGQPSAAPPAATVAGTSATGASTSASPPSAATGTAARTATASATPGRYGPVRPDDTLWSVAMRVRPGTGVSPQRMMVALQQANPEAFIGHNINLLRAGTVLKIPTGAELARISQRQALAEIKAQNVAWRRMRGVRAANPVPIAAKAGGAAAGARKGAAKPNGEAAKPTGKTTKSGSAKETSSGAGAGGARLEVLAAGAKSQQGAPGGQQAQAYAALQKQVELANETAQAAKNEAAAMQNRLQQVEAVLTDLKRLVNLRDATIAQLQKQLAAREAAERAQAAREAAAAKSRSGVLSAIEDALAPVVSEARTLPRALGIDPTYLWGGVGVVLLGLIALAFARRRRGAPEPGSVDEADAVTRFDSSLPGSAREDATALPQERSAHARVQSSGSAAPAAQAGTVTAGGEDPLAEVNNYLAYEHFDEAKALVRRAIERFPDRHEYRVRLLDVLRQARDVAGFAAAAVALRELTGDGSDEVRRAEQWWSELAPGREPFDVGDDSTTTELRPSAARAPEGDAGPEGESVDFDLGLGDWGKGAAPGGAGDQASAPSAAEEKAPVGEGTGEEPTLVGALEDSDSTTRVDSGQTGLDFDLGLDEPTMEVTRAPRSEAGEDAPAVPESAQGSALDFDLGLEDPTLTGAAPAATEEEVPKEAESTAGAHAVDFDLGMEDPTLGGKAGGEPEAPGEASVTGQASALDFDLGLEEPAPTSAAPEQASSPDAGSPPPRAATPDEEAPADDGVTSSLGDDLSEFDLGVEDFFLGDEQESPGAAAGEQAAGRAAPQAEGGLGIDLDDGTIDASEREAGSPPPSAQPGTAGDSDAARHDMIQKAGELPEVALKPPEDGAEPLSDIDFDLGTADLALPGLDTEPGEDLQEPPAGAPEEEEEEATILRGRGNAGQTQPAASAPGTPAEERSLAAPEAGDAEAASAPAAAQGEAPEEEEATVLRGRGIAEQVDEIQTRLDLAQAYIDMGDREGARGILGEVMKQGNAGQIAQARALLERMG